MIAAIGAVIEWVHRSDFQCKVYQSRGISLAAGARLCRAKVNTRDWGQPIFNTNPLEYWQNACLFSSQLLCKRYDSINLCNVIASQMINR